MALLEGFESFSGGLPDTLNWSDISAGSGNTISQSSSNVTEGSFSCRMQSADVANGTPAIKTPEEINLSTASTLFLDVTISTIQTDTYIELLASIDGEGETVFIDAPNSVGSYTLELDISPLSSKTAVGIAIFAYTFGPAGALDFYIDNLRDDAGVGGAITVMDVTDPADVMGVDLANIASVMGVST